jgi:hypothetical protein
MPKLCIQSVSLSDVVYAYSQLPSCQSYLIILICKRWTKQLVIPFPMPLSFRPRAQCEKCEVCRQWENSCFWVIWGCWYQKSTFPACTVALYPRNWTRSGPNGFKVGVKNLIDVIKSCQNGYQIEGRWEYFNIALILSHLTKPQTLEGGQIGQSGNFDHPFTRSTCSMNNLIPKYFHRPPWLFPCRHPRGKGYWDVT